MKSAASAKKREKKKVPRKGKPIAKKGKIQDLCTTCNHRAECVNATDEKRPIHYCEEYEDYTPQAEVPSPEIMPVEAAPEVGTPKYTGICVNCDYRETCANSSTEGGIWHCEEYA